MVKSEQEDEEDWGTLLLSGSEREKIKGRPRPAKRVRRVGVQKKGPKGPAPAAD